MKTLIIYQSIHHLSTEKIVKHIASEPQTDLIKLSKVNSGSLIGYDRIGFASGVYFYKPHQLFYKKLPVLEMKNKNIFLITTSGTQSYPIFADYHKSFRRLFEESGLNIVAWFETRGYDTYPLFVRPFGGINKGRPNQKDLDKALSWYRKLLVN